MVGFQRKKLRKKILIEQILWLLTYPFIGVGVREGDAPLQACKWKWSCFEMNGNSDVNCCGNWCVLSKPWPNGTGLVFNFDCANHFLYISIETCSCFLLSISLAFWFDDSLFFFVCSIFFFFFTHATCGGKSFTNDLTSSSATATDSLRFATAFTAACRFFSSHSA